MYVCMHTQITHICIQPYTNSCVYYCIDPVEVIGLYKGLLPSEFQSYLSNLHPTEPPPLEGEALTRATKCLIDFLNQVQPLANHI